MNTLLYTTTLYCIHYCTQQHFCTNRHTTVQTDTLLYKQAHHCTNRHTTVQIGTPLYKPTHYCTNGHTTVQTDTPLYKPTHYCTNRHTTVQTDTLLYKRTHYCTNQHATVQTDTLLYKPTYYCTYQAESHPGYPLSVACCLLGLLLHLVSLGSGGIRAHQQLLQRAHGGSPEAWGWGRLGCGGGMVHRGAQHPQAVTQPQRGLHGQLVFHVSFLNHLVQHIHTAQQQSQPMLYSATVTISSVHYHDDNAVFSNSDHQLCTLTMTTIDVLSNSDHQLCTLTMTVNCLQ